MATEDKPLLLPIYSIESFDLTTDRDNELLHDVHGNYLAAWTDGSFEGITLRFNYGSADEIPLKKFNGISAEFETVYLTHTSQSGCVLTLLYGRAMSAWTSGGGQRSVDMLAKTTLFNKVVAAGATDVLSADLVPTFLPSLFRITVVLTVATTFVMTIERSGTTISPTLNGGANLVANSLYTFDVPVRANDNINFQLGAAATLSLLNVDEIATAGP